MGQAGRPVIIGQRPVTSSTTNAKNAATSKEKKDRHSKATSDWSDLESSTAESDDDIGEPLDNLFKVTDFNKPKSKHESKQ